MMSLYLDVLWFFSCHRPLGLLAAGVYHIRKLVKNGDLEYKKAPKVNFQELKKSILEEPSYFQRFAMAYTAWREYRFPGVWAKKTEAAKRWGVLIGNTSFALGGLFFSWGVSKKLGNAFIVNAVGKAIPACFFSALHVTDFFSTICLLGHRDHVANFQACQNAVSNALGSVIIGMQSSMPASYLPDSVKGSLVIILATVAGLISAFTALVEPVFNIYNKIKSPVSFILSKLPLSALAGPATTFFLKAKAFITKRVIMVIRARLMKTGKDALNAQKKLESDKEKLAVLQKEIEELKPKIEAEQDQKERKDLEEKLDSLLTEEAALKKEMGFLEEDITRENKKLGKDPSLVMIEEAELKNSPEEIERQKLKDLLRREIQIADALGHLKIEMASIDADGSGDVTIDELRTAMRQADPGVTEAQVQKIFTEMDVSRDGKISISEYTDFKEAERQKLHDELAQLKQDVKLQEALLEQLKKVPSTGPLARNLHTSQSPVDEGPRDAQIGAPAHAGPVGAGETNAVHGEKMNGHDLYETSSSMCKSGARFDQDIELVQLWLRDMGTKRTVMKVFREQHVDVEALAAMNNKHLMLLGITKVGLQNKLISRAAREMESRRKNPEFLWNPLYQTSESNKLMKIASSPQVVVDSSFVYIDGPDKNAYDPALKRTHQSRSVYLPQPNA